MKRTYCSDCNRVEYRQAIETWPIESKKEAAWGLIAYVVVLAGVFFALAWGLSR